MKKPALKTSFCILLLIVLFLMLIALLVWDHLWNKVIFGCASALYLFVSLHKFIIIVLKDHHKQSLVCGWWRYATILCFGGYLALFLEERFGS